MRTYTDDEVSIIIVKSYERGYEVGHKEGRDEGYSDGYSDGYDDTHFFNGGEESR